MLGSLSHRAAFSSGPSHPPEVSGQPSISDTSGRVEIPIYKESVPVKVIFALGQSNIFNTASDTSFVPSAGTENFDYLNLKNYVAKDPLLGCPCLGGATAGYSSWTTRLASKFVDAGVSQRVIIVNCAVGGTLVSDWDAGGVLDGRVAFAIRAMLQAGLKPDYTLWMQGESDSLAGTTAANYTTRLRSVINTMRHNGLFGPVFVSQTAAFTGATAPNITAVRTGQSNAWSNALGIFQGPDTDTLYGSPYRSADGHLVLAGLDPMANLWKATLQAYIAAHP
jgi:hypothetical protein